MKNIAIIPARKGSQRIPEKNIKILHDKPLIAYSIEHALQGFKRNQLCINELKHFLEAVSEKTVPTVNIKTGLATLRMALAARKSMETGEPIGL